MSESWRRSCLTPALTCGHIWENVRPLTFPCDWVRFLVVLPVLFIYVLTYCLLQSQCPSSFCGDKYRFMLLLGDAPSVLTWAVLRATGHVILSTAFTVRTLCKVSTGKKQGTASG
jgi:hypothetical protein